MAQKQITDHALFKLGKSLLPYVTGAGALIGVLWSIFTGVQTISTAIKDHLADGPKIIAEQKKTNDRLDTLIALGGGRNRQRLTGSK